MENLDNHSDFTDIKDSHNTDTIDSSNGFENLEEEFMKAIQAQLNYNADNSNSQEHLECIRKLEVEGYQ